MSWFANQIAPYFNNSFRILSWFLEKYSAPIALSLAEALISNGQCGTFFAEEMDNACNQEFATVSKVFIFQLEWAKFAEIR